MTNSSEPKVDKHGNKRWYNENGQLHRGGDLPASVCASGNKQWFKNGKRHRANGPAIVWINGAESWFKNGKRHRDGDLPASVSYDGTKSWFKNGKIQAIEWPDGDRESF